MRVARSWFLVLSLSLSLFDTPARAQQTEHWEWEPSHASPTAAESDAERRTRERRERRARRPQRDERIHPRLITLGWVILALLVVGLPTGFVLHLLGSLIRSLQDARKLRAVAESDERPGAQPTRKCVSCGSALPEGPGRCPQCGAPVDGVAR